MATPAAAWHSLPMLTTRSLSIATTGRGTFEILIEDGKHRYDFEYQLP